MASYFTQKIATSQLLGQDNFLHYLGDVKIAIRVEEDEYWDSLLLTVLATVVCRSNLTLSVSKKFNHEKLSLLKNFAIKFSGDYKRETTFRFMKNIRHYKRVRCLSPQSASNKVMLKADQKYVPVISHTPCKHGQFELFYYLQEQVISHNYHRYGNLGLRGKQV